MIVCINFQFVWRRMIVSEKKDKNDAIWVLDFVSFCVDAKKVGRRGVSLMAGRLF